MAVGTDTVTGNSGSLGVGGVSASCLGGGAASFQHLPLQVSVAAVFCTDSFSIFYLS